MRQITHASLFSGIGGAEIAADWAGWQNLFHCEINSFCRRVLEYHYPNSESYDDITKTEFTAAIIKRGCGKSAAAKAATKIL